MLVFGGFLPHTAPRQGVLVGRNLAYQPIVSSFLLLVLLMAVRTEAAAQNEASASSSSIDSKVQEENAVAAGPNSKESGGGFFKRLFKVYRDDWEGAVPVGPEPARRIPPAPLDSPPFPNADWPYGGAPDIGAPDTNIYPLMQAINGGSSKIKVYGWVEPSLNISTSKHTLFPSGYNVFPNRVVLDQAVLYIEKLADTVQSDHVDFGFHLTGFYGVDYRFTTAKGWLSQQLLKYNRQYGFDPMLEYADIYIPQVADGMNIRIGRYLSIPDIEAQLAPNNYIFTHSLLYSFDPFTQTGVLATMKLNDHWLVQAGLSAGNDIAPWAKDAKPSLTACVSHTFNNGNDNLYPCVSGINSGKYGYNNVQFFVSTWNHKFNKSWHMATEAWYMYQRNVPSVTPGLANPLPTETNANGAFCGQGQLKCFAPEWAIVNYLQKEFNAKNYISIRTDYLDDRKGQRTGFPTKYSEHTLMWGHWIGNTVLFRPEFRFEHSYDLPAYDSGAKKNQFTFAMDVVYKF